jgi:hypothetical protein
LVVCTAPDDQRWPFCCASHALTSEITKSGWRVNLTVGTSTDCSEIYTADWSQLYVGLRTSFTLRFLQERFIDNGQYGFLAYLRGDIALAQPSAFVVDAGVTELRGSW